MRAVVKRAGRLALLCGLVATMGVEAESAQEQSRFTWDEYVSHEVRTRNTRQPQPSFECIAPDRRTVNRVVGGFDAPPGMASWQVSVQDRFEGSWRNYCGGSLISPSWVLTAAHCFTDQSGVQDKFEDDFRIMHGSQSLAAAGEFRGVERIVLHDGYDPRPNLHDIALMRLAEPFRGAQPVQLQSPQLDRVFGSPGACSVVTGWGETKAWRAQQPPRSSGRSTASRLQAVDLPIIDNATCASIYPNVYPIGEITAGNVCAGYEQGTRDSCQGDSGGPLVVPGGPTGWTQIGVVSYGWRCAQPRAYGVYTRVSYYIDWILDQTGSR